MKNVIEGQKRIIEQCHASNVNKLPRLLYIADLEVEASCAGTILLYRLLSGYPVDKLCIVESNLATSTPKKRLADVQYHCYNFANTRPLFTRFNKEYSTFLALFAEWRTSYLGSIVKEFQPEAILTVAHKYSWLIAAKIARINHIPLHLIIHDEWTTQVPHVGFATSFFAAKFGDIYRQAQSRLCVSSFMEEHYRKLYGERGTVFYPYRSTENRAFDSPPERLGAAQRPLVFGYAGGGATFDFARALAALADLLKESGSTLRIHSPITKETAVSLGLDRVNVDIRPVIPSDLLIKAFHEEIDVLFLPMEFDADAKVNTQFCFPSKLADYTAMGLPILIWGPSYCSAVRWAGDNSGVAEIVTVPDLSELRRAITRLQREGAHRVKLARGAIQTGKKYFSFEAARDTFYKSIAGEIGDYK